MPLSAKDILVNGLVFHWCFHNKIEHYMAIWGDQISLSLRFEGNLEDLSSDCFKNDKIMNFFYSAICKNSNMTPTPTQPASSSSVIALSSRSITLDPGRWHWQSMVAWYHHILCWFNYFRILPVFWCRLCVHMQF